MSDERLPDIQDQVRAALDRRSDERYRLDIEPRYAGYALVRSAQNGVDNVFDGDPVMAWKPTLGDLQQQILADDAAHFTLKERTMDPLGTTDPIGRIEPEPRRIADNGGLNLNLPEHRAILPENYVRPHNPDNDIRIPDWPKVRQETPPQAPQALKDEQGILSRAYSWFRDHITPQQARALQENQVRALRVPPQTLTPE